MKQNKKMTFKIILLSFASLLISSFAYCQTPSSSTAEAFTSGGETGNGGDITFANQVSALYGRIGQEAETLCRNHPERSADSVCASYENYNQVIKKIAFIPMKSLFLCSNQTPVIGGRADTEALLAKMHLAQSGQRSILEPKAKQTVNFRFGSVRKLIKRPSPRLML